MDDEKIVGILGGMGPEATAYCFKRIIDLTQAKKDQDHLRVVIDSNPKIPDRISSIEKNDNRILELLCETARNLQKAQANFIIIPCNTAHYYINEIASAVNIPVLNMIEETVKEINRVEVNAIGVLGTNMLIKTKLYQNMFDKYGIKYIVPDDESQKNIMGIIKLVKEGYDKEKIKNNLFLVTKKLMRKGSIGILLGCTELPLVFPYSKFNIPIFDSTTILAKAAIRFALCKK